MAEYRINVDGALLPGLMQGKDGLAQLVESVLNQILELRVSEALGAERGAANSARSGRGGCVHGALAALVWYFRPAYLLSCYRCFLVRPTGCFAVARIAKRFC